jgi:beta-lactamase superfamily II metal-dependent hydrolase
MNRREFLRNSSGIVALGAGFASPTLANGGRPDLPAENSTLPPWQPGFLDIHHINTGRGNATLLILPDGTSLLVDAGASSTQGPSMCPARPDTSRRPGQWIARYIERQIKPTERDGIDYALLTHLHGDHLGDVSPTSPEAASGGYKLTGISDVAEVMPIGKLIDRGFPDYGYPIKVTDATGINYIQYARFRARRGHPVELVQVGSSHQIAQLREHGSHPRAIVRVVAADGRIWTGAGKAGEDEASVSQFPDQTELDATHQASENSCSIALRLNYGRFSYFTGGDLTSDTRYGLDPWRDTESPAGQAAGPVSVATCNHHGYFDATGPSFVRAVQPRVWILQSWHASHPALSTLANLYSPVLYPGPRDVFCLGLHPAAAMSCARFSDQFKSSQGHVVVRIAPGGDSYTVLILEDGDERNRLKGIFGPYAS